MKLFTNIGKIYTLEKAYKKAGKNIQAEDLSIKKGLSLLVDKKGQIVWLGKKSSLPKKYELSKTIDLAGQNVFPAFLDCHTHMVFAGNRSHEFELRNQGHSYQDIARQGGGIAYTVKESRKASKGQLLDLAQERTKRFVQQGVTTIEVKSGYGLDFKYEKKLLEVAKELKLARIITTYLGPHAKSPEYQDLDSYLERITEKDLAKVKQLGLSNRVDIFIEQGYFNFQHLRSYVSKAKELGFDICIHADQMSSSEITSFAVENNVKSLDHLVYIQDKEMAALANSNTTAVLLPSAEKYIHIPYPPARKLLNAGCRVALASDFNPGSSPTQDLSFVGVLARLDLKMSLSETFVAYTLNAAYALGLESDLGSITVGKTADFFTSKHDLEDFFYGVGQHPVCEVYREGKRLLKN